MVGGESVTLRSLRRADDGSEMVSETCRQGDIPAGDWLVERRRRYAVAPAALHCVEAYCLRRPPGGSGE